MNRLMLHPSPTDEDWRRYEDVLDRFEVEWRADRPPAIADFLPHSPDAARSHLLRELIKLDLEYRWRRGERILVESYARQFPELNESAGLLLELLAEECGVRELAGVSTTQSELLARFSERHEELQPLLKRLAKIDADAERRSADVHEAASHDTDTMLETFTNSPTDSGLSRTKSSWPGADRLGRYRLLEQVGRGAFATVFRAHDPDLDRDVAIKVPHPELLEAADFRVRLLNEARAAAKLRHPGIVPIHEVGQQTGVPYIVYECIEGTTLARRLKDQRPQPEQAAAWALRVAEALQHAHSRGIIHRDLKPSNIMLDADDQPVVADFGLALAVNFDGTLTAEGDVLGTPAYMPPEQAQGLSHAADARSDVYSLGVVLYEMLCGRPPFQGSLASILHKVIHDEPPSLQSLSQTVPRDLETICVKAMSKEPSGRYESAGAMADDLRRHLDQQPIRARRPSLMGRSLRWTRRHVAPLVIGTLTAIILISAGIAITFNSRGTDNVPLRQPTSPAANVPARIPQAEAPAAWKLDGTLLACAYQADNLDLVLLDRDGKVTKNLTNHPAKDSFPAWSPDGRTIAFESDRSGRQNIWLMDADGGSLREVTTSPLRDETPAWSPDGQRIALARLLSFNPSKTHGLESEIVVMNADGTNLMALTHATTTNMNPAWSPDGRRIAFTSTRATELGFRLFVMDADGQNVEMLTTKDNQFGCVFPAWSPDGTRLAYSDLVEGGVELFILDLTTKITQKLTTLGGINSSAAWSPDAGQIAFQHYSSSKLCKLFVMKPDGSHRMLIAEESLPLYGMDRRPVWQPAATK